MQRTVKRSDDFARTNEGHGHNATFALLVDGLFNIFINGRGSYKSIEFSRSRPSIDMFLLEISTPVLT
jgi:hypothetical protein